MMDIPLFAACLNTPTSIEVGVLNRSGPLDMKNIFMYIM